MPTPRVPCPGGGVHSKTPLAPRGPIFVSDLNLHFGLHQDPPALLPPISREQTFSQDTDPPTLPGGGVVTLQHQLGAIRILSLWDRHPGCQSSFRTYIFILDFTKIPCTFTSDFSRTRVFPAYQPPPTGYPARGSLYNTNGVPSES